LRRAKYGVVPERALLEAAGVHGTALALAGAGHLAVQFGHDGVAGHAAAKEHAVLTVGRANDVAVLEVEAGAGHTGFLTDAEVDESGKHAGREQVREPLLKQPDIPHIPVEFDQIIISQLH